MGSTTRPRSPSPTAVRI